MRTFAIRTRRRSGPKVLDYEEVDLPGPGLGEVPMRAAAKIPAAVAAGHEEVMDMLTEDFLDRAVVAHRALQSRAITDASALVP